MDSRLEVGSMIVAVVAIILSGVATFEQFFRRTSSLSALPQRVGLDMRGEPGELRLSLLLVNASETPGVLQSAYLFLSPDRSTPGGAHADVPNNRFWWGESLEDQIIVDENAIREVTLSLGLDADHLERFRTATQTDPEGGEWNIGVTLIAMDIDGDRHMEERFVGTLTADGLRVVPEGSGPLHLY